MFLYNFFTGGRPVFPQVKIDKVLPSLNNFVSPDSWLIFDLLDLKGAQTWLQHSCNTWSSDADYRSFKNFAENLAVVNDIAERGVKLISDVIDMSEDDRQRHFITQVIEWHREEYPVYTKNVPNKL